MDFVWIANDQGDITGITATTPLTGGGSSGAVTVGIQDALTTQKGAVQLSDSTSTTSSILAATSTAVKSSYDLADAAIPKSTVTTAGDVIYATGSSAVTRLGIGSTGQVLTVAAGIPSWATASGGSTNVAGKNAVLNSSMNVWQRGTSISLAASAGTTYLADRYCTQTGANQACTVSRQATGDTTNLSFIQYAMRYQRNSGQTGTGALSVMQPMETVNSIPFAGKTVTMSFYARAGANYTAASNALAFYLRTGTGTDQNPFAGYTGDTLLINTTATLTTTWQRFSASATMSASATEMTAQFTYTPVGTASTNDYYEVTGVQVEIAASASAYSPNTSTYATELAACQRYYQEYGNTGYNFIASISASGGNLAFVTDLPVKMRTGPSISHNLTNANYTSAWNLDVAYVTGGVAKTGTVTINSTGVDTSVTFAFSGATWASTPNVFALTATTGFIKLSAEL
jgi:hypothetical protein